MKKYHTTAFKLCAVASIVMAVFIILGIILMTTIEESFMGFIIVGAILGFVSLIVLFIEHYKDVVIKENEIILNEGPRRNGKKEISISVPFAEIVNIRRVERERFRNTKVWYEFLLKNGDVISHEFEHISGKDMECILKTVQERMGK